MNRAIFREGLKQKNMENNTELLKEYASLAGREDAKSEARKAEILSYIKAHANDADREEAKAFIGQKMEQIKDNVEVLRKQIETEDYKTSSSSLHRRSLLRQECRMALAASQRL